MHFIRNKCKGSVLMKISLSAILFTSAASLWAGPSTGQNLKEIKVHMGTGTISLKDALRQVEKQTNIRFTYISKDVNPVKVQTTSSTGTAVSTILNNLLANTGLVYEQVGRTVLIKKKNDAVNTDTPQNNGADFKQGQWHGRIVDEQGTPLRGVTIRLKNTAQVFTSAADGTFSLPAQEKGILVISYVGYQSREIQVNAATNGLKDISLLPDFGSLDAVTVIAYGTSSKRVSTGSTATVTSADIQKAPINNPLEALQGRVAGLDINASSGLPGSSFSVRLRGLNSVSKDNSPLYVVDGIPYFSESLNMFNGDNGKQSPLAAINPNDIERIDVLKDADATAIYGSRAANGVILITTKKGKAGETKANFNVYSGAGKVTNFVDMLSTSEYLELRKEAFKNSKVETGPAQLDLFEWDPNLDQNWQKRLFGETAKLTEANASFSGGSELTNFLLSGTFRNETTVQPGSNGYKKGAGLLSVNHKNASGKFSITGSANFTGDFNNALATDITQYYNLAPNIPTHNPDGSFYWYGNTQNPLAYLLRKHETRNKALLTSSSVQYSPVNGLKLLANVGYNYTTLNQTQMFPSKSFNPETSSGSMSYFGNGSQNSYTVEPQISYTYQLGKGNLDLLAGGTWQQVVNDGSFYQAEDFASDAQLDNPSAAVSLRARDIRYYKYRYNAFFGRATYNWENKYILNGAFRRDGSSRFGPNKRVGNFGSVGAAWVFSEEKGVQEALPFLTFGKLRGSYGVTGNDQIGNYGYMDTWSFTSYPYGGSSGLYPTRVDNPNYSWESTRKLEAGLELGFFANRLTVNVNSYFNKTDNLLIGQRLASQTGFTSYLANLPGVVQNRGWEFEVGSVNVKNNDFEWSTNLNLTISKNKLVAYPDLEGSPNAQYYALGHPIDIVFGYKFTGVDPQTGIAQFADLSGDGAVKAELADQYIMGTHLPKFFGGLNNSFTYKNFNLSFLLQFVKQEGEQMNYGYQSNAALGIMSNFDKSVLNRWRNPGDVTDIPRAAAVSTDPAYVAYNTFYRHSDAFWGDASYIRLKNLSISYDFTSLLSVLKTQSISLYGQGQNLFTITKYKGFDPETKGYGLPPMKFYTVGIRFTY